jgi:DNA invertase Pin-like site-specific DNA recombinase
MAKKKQSITPPITDDELVEYVIYCRKSTDESSQKQVASIPRQIEHCVNYAKNNNLIIKEKTGKNFPFEDAEDILKDSELEDIEDRKILQKYKNLYIIKEQKSAMKPYQRKKWRLLVKMVQEGKVRGIISYSPDRQARNIVEGGELIDFADQAIADLKYTNFHFEPTASGKMMLGIWFVFSKQYSDKLSEDVINANQRKFEKGETLGDIKHGYTRDENNKWVPDGSNFDLIKKAFEIRLEEKWSNQAIADWLNNNGYRRLIKSTEKEIPISKNSVSNLWTDPFYYGVWLRSGEVIDLRDEKHGFVPMINYPQHEELCERYKSFEEKQKNSGINKEDDLVSLRMIDNDFVIYEDKDGQKYNFTLNLPNKNTRHRKKLIKLRETNPKADFADFIEPHQVKLKCNFNNLSFTLKDIDAVVHKKLRQLHLTQESYDAFLQYSHDRLDIEFQEINESRQMTPASG